ncbi:MAG: TonB-dependent receptor [Cyclobacteriaceae bacterium]
MRKIFITLFTLLVVCYAHSQNGTQTVKGRIIDKDTRQPLIGAAVKVIDVAETVGAVADINGYFEIGNVPVGRRTFQCQYVGYQPEVIELIVNSAQEAVLDLELIEAVITTGEVVISAYKTANAPVNELAVVSARSFSPEETERYAASVNDPGRMALSFPGVSQGKDEAENDIIIRGNSSRGMLWRLEGIDIPNPNHFARPGTSGGGVTVFSAQLLSKSDFSSGAMPAEYGNALSGAFDVNFRAGNLTNREYRTKIGLLGLDFMAEGPIKNKKSSYLVNYRYSTLGLLTNMGVYLVGPRVTNEFQDLSFNTTYLLGDGKDVLTVFGIGGLSQEHYQPVANPSERDYRYPSEWEDRVRTHNMGALGLTYTKTLDETSYLKWVVATMGNYQYFVNDTLNEVDDRYNYGIEEYADWRIATSLTFNKKFSNTTKLKSGLQVNQIFYDFYRQESPRSSSSTLDPNAVFGVSLDGEDNTQTVQFYTQLNQRMGEKFTMNVGFHTIGLLLNNSWGIDPRVSFQYAINPKNSLSLALGKHSQIVPLGAYFYKDADGNTTNDELGLMQAYHLIGGYRISIGNSMMINLEGYYQQLNNIPAMANGSQEYWLMNSSSGFPTFALNNEAEGQNVGVDLAIEKFFSKGFFMLVTGSVFESLFSANDGPMYSSSYNTKFSSTYTFAKEWEIKGINTLQIGTRVLFNGGYRYTPFDEAASLAEGRYIPLGNAINAGQVDPYFRIDGRIQYRRNGAKIASVLSLDIQNATNRFNPNGVSYNAVDNELVFRRYSSGLVPVLSYQIDF